METMRDVAAIIGLILSIISLITLSTKGGRAFIKSVFAKNTKDLRQINEQQTEDIREIKDSLEQICSKLDAVEQVSKQQCRDTIKTIYYKYCQVKKIPLYERKTVDHNYELYVTRFNGNTYTKILYDEIVKWEIEPPKPHDIDEGEC